MGYNWFDDIAEIIDESITDLDEWGQGIQYVTCGSLENSVLPGENEIGKRLDYPLD